MKVSQIEPILSIVITVCSGTLAALVDASACLDWLLVACEECRLVSQSSGSSFVPMNVALRNRRGLRSGSS